MADPSKPKKDEDDDKKFSSLARRYMMAYLHLKKCKNEGIKIKDNDGHYQTIEKL